MGKTILKDFEDLYNTYWYVNEIEFALCSEKINGRAELLTQFATCREVVIGDVFAKFSGNFNGRRKTFGHRIKKIPVNKICIAIRLIRGIDEHYRQHDKPRFARLLKEMLAIDKTFPKAIDLGIHILNLIESHYGWNKTTATMANIKKNTDHSIDEDYDEDDDPNIDEENPFIRSINIRPHSSIMKVAYICADKKWMRSPHLFSLFLLLLRFPFTTTSPNVLSDTKTLNSLLEKLVIARGKNRDGEYIRTASKHLKTIFENLDKFFFKNMKMNYDREEYDSLGFITEGIATLCNGRSTNSKAMKAFRELILCQNKNSKVSKTPMRPQASANY